MKNLALLVLAFCVVCGNAKVSQIPSYLEHVGSYKFNKTDTGKFTVKEYYLSQQIKYTWTQSYLFCKAAGMRLATIESERELEHMNSFLTTHSQLFLESFYVDIHFASETEKSSDCFNLFREKQNQLGGDRIYCNRSDEKIFMCEDVDVVDEYVEPTAEVKPKRTDLDVRKTFFSYLGSYENHDVKKSYFFNGLMAANVSVASQICQAFGMILAAPQNQSQFEQLKKLFLESENIQRSNALIAGYRSKEKTNKWISSMQEIKYKIDKETNIDGDQENCIALKIKDGEANAFAFPCTARSNFICEFDDLKPSPLASVDDENLLKFMKPLTHYRINDTTKHLFLSEISYNWLQSKLACQSFGMELFMYENKAEEAKMKEAIKNIGNSRDTVNIGACNVGDDYPYNINTGKVIDFTIIMDTYYLPNQCLQMKKHRDANEFMFSHSHCQKNFSKFICQQVKPWVPGDDSTTTQSPDQPETFTEEASGNGGYLIDE